MRKRLQQLAGLSFEEWRLLVSALLLLPVIALSLQVKGFGGTQRWLQKYLLSASQTDNCDNSHRATAVRVARMVGIAANHGIYRTNCLKTSLATWWLLQRRGITTEVKIGVNKDEGGFKAHAWVEYRGEAVHQAGSVAEKFPPFVF